MSAIGAWAHVAYNLGGLISFFATIGLIAMLHMTPAFDENVPKRTLFLFGIGFFQGCSIGPLLAYTLELDPLYASSLLLSSSYALPHGLTHFFNTTASS
jgi:hypothetical protein